MNKKCLSILSIGLLLSACSAAAIETPPMPTQPVAVTPTLLPTETATPLTPTTVSSATGETSTAIPAATSTSIPNTTDVCSDPEVVALIDSLKTAVLNSDGPLLESLISPANGLDVRWVRYGTVVNYQPSQARFLFETTYEVDWGAQPGSGEPKVGSFHDVIVPDLEKVFNQAYALNCNELEHGGASYDLSWPYNKGFFSVYFPGTAANGSMDWRTWAAGIEYVNGKPYLYALIQFLWEP